MTTRRWLVLGAAVVAIGTTTAFAATLSVGSWHLWSGSQTLTKGTCTLSGSSSTLDTYVDQANSNSSFGGNTTMVVGAVSGSRKWAFVRFDLSSCNIPSTGGADSATLTLRITSAPFFGARTIDVDPVLSSWSESSTWNNAQSFSFGPTIASFSSGTTSNVSKSVTVTATVDDLIKSSTANFGWRLADNGGSAFLTTSFGSSENGTSSNRPQLVINYEK